MPITDAQFTRSCYQCWSRNSYCSCNICTSFTRMKWTPELLLDVYGPIMEHADRWVGKCTAYPQASFVIYRPRRKYDPELINAVKARKWLKEFEGTMFYKQQITNLCFYLEDKNKDAWNLLVPQVQNRMKPPNFKLLCIPLNLY